MAKISLTLMAASLCLFSTGCGTSNLAVSGAKALDDQSPQPWLGIKLNPITCEDPGVIWHTLSESPKSPHDLLELMDKIEPRVNFGRTSHVPDKMNLGYKYGNCRNGSGGFFILVHDLSKPEQLGNGTFLPPRKAGHCYTAWVYLTGEFKDSKLVRGSWTHLIEPDPTHNKDDSAYEKCQASLGDGRTMGFYLEGRWDHSATTEVDKGGSSYEKAPFSGEFMYMDKIVEGDFSLDVAVSQTLKAEPTALPLAMLPGISFPRWDERSGQHFDMKNDRRRYLGNVYYEDVFMKDGIYRAFFTNAGKSPLKHPWISAAKKRAEFMKLQRADKIAGEAADAKRARDKAYQDEIDANRTTNDFCKMFRDTYSSGRECGLACIRDHGRGSAACLRNCDKCFN